MQGFLPQYDFVCIRKTYWSLTGYHRFSWNLHLWNCHACFFRCKDIVFGTPPSLLHMRISSFWTGIDWVYTLYLQCFFVLKTVFPAVMIVSYSSDVLPKVVSKQLQAGLPTYCRCPRCPKNIVGGSKQSAFPKSVDGIRSCGWVSGVKTPRGHQVTMKAHLSAPGVVIPDVWPGDYGDGSQFC